MIRNFYLYLDNNSYSDYYCSSSILCDELLPNKKGTKTVSRLAQSFLFLTHLKLDSESRTFGITELDICWPVILELSIDRDMFERFPVLFLTKERDNLILENGDIGDYNELKHCGCFVYGELPFSTVKKILFENDVQRQDSDKSVFPDFLWKNEIAKLINPDEFTEKFVPAFSNEELLLAMQEESSIDWKVIEKYKAAILMLINGTKNWSVKKYRTSYDQALLQYFEIDDNIIKDVLNRKQNPIPPDNLDGTLESLELIPTELSKTDGEQGVYNAIVSTLTRRNEQWSLELRHQLIEEIKIIIKDFQDESLSIKYCELLDSIEACCSNKVGYNVDDVVRSISSLLTDNSTLKSLLFVLKNPDDFSKFVSSLSIYNLDALSSRRAMIMWGFLNGMKGIPVDGYERDNPELFANIEWKVSKLFCEIKSRYVLIKPSSSYLNPCGINICSEEIITCEEVHGFLKNYDRSLIPNYLLKNIYNIAKLKDKKRFKEDPYSYYDTGSVYKQLGELSNKLSKTNWTDICKKLKCLKPVLQYDAIYNDWILDYENFKKIWLDNEKYLKDFYLDKRSK